MNILISGGSGLIGYNLARTLVEMGYNVYSISGGNGNTPVGNVIYRGMFGITPRDLPDKVDCLFHCAANNDTRSNNLEEMIRLNVEDSLRLFSMCFFRGCKNIIYASSAAVYGNSEVPYVEDKTPLNPLNSYAKSKLRLESEAETFGKDRKIRMVGLRYCNVYGPGETHKAKRASMIHQLLNCKRDGERPKLFRDGTQKRDWLYVYDAVQANILAMKNAASGIFNIGSGQATSFNDLVRLIFGETEIDWLDCSFPEEYQSHTCCSILKANKEFGFTPKIALAEGILGAI